ncbi:hypothetical protein WN943_016608 [Citrus x changshan-huyou]
MKHVVKILTLLVAITALWFGLLQTSVIPRSHTGLLPIYFIVSLGCYGLLMVGIGLMYFPTCPQEALLLQQVLYFACSCHAGMRLLMSSVFYKWMPSFCLIIKKSILSDFDHIDRKASEFGEGLDIKEAKEYLERKGIDVSE